MRIQWIKSWKYGSTQGPAGFRASNPVMWLSRSVTLRFTCDRNIVFQHKFNFCVDVERMVCFPRVWLCFICVSFKITHINNVFVCVYFEFTLLSSTWWTQNGFKPAHREHQIHEHTLAPICCKAGGVVWSGWLTLIPPWMSNHIPR